MFSFWDPTITTNIIWEDNSKQNQLMILSNVEMDSTLYCNWKRNRPADLIRVETIAKYFALNDIRLVPGVVYVWKPPGNPTAYVYDGIHRLLATFKTDHCMRVLIHLKTTPKEQEIIDDFTALNQSISVPSVFMEEKSDTDKRRVCVAVAERMCARFPAFVSASRKPAGHNFSRDQLIELVSTLDIDFTQTELETRIVDALISLNTEARESVNTHNIRYPQKCVTHDFFVFLLGYPKIRERLLEKVK